MNRKKFVSNIKDVLRDDQEDSFIEIYDNPPGRKPTKKVQRISSWYHSLSPDQKNGLKEMLQSTLDSAYFHFFCVLDGISRIDDEPERWIYELYAVSETGERVFLNDPDSREEDLHDIYQGLTWSSE